MGKMEGGEEMMNEEESIVVSVRLRPLNEKEISKSDVSDWECINDTTVVYKNANLSASERSMYPSAYTFDRVFRTNCSTRQVYEEGARQVALSAVSGINATVFAYGQTSSGKTYTMSGITEYTIGDIYDYVQKHGEREFILKFSAMEIYNECVRDLLSTDTSPLRLLDDPERGTVVEKLTEETLRDWDHVMELLSFCQEQRQIGETALNETSSRSHQILRLTIESSAREFLGRDNFSTLTASVNFVDLAGSERASQSLSAGARLKEGCHINRSLLTLGTVIRKLSKGKNGHIPFRDSKLTRILQSSLAGNARIAVICTMSPARTHVEQSRNTLLFASCAKEVTTNAQVNIVMSEKALVKHLQRELSRLESQLHSPRATIVTADNSAIIRDKDRQIEQLEKEVKDLILQRDIAQAQAKDLLKLLGGDNSPLMRVGLGQYPNLRIHESPADSRRFSYGHSRSSSECNSTRIPDSDNLSNHDTFPPVCVGTSSFSETESFQAWGVMERRSNASSEDICKEVRCVELEEVVESQSNNGDSDNPKQPVPPMEEGRNHQEPEEDHNDMVDSPSLKDHEKELRCFETPFKDFLKECESFKLTRSRSCEASIFTDRTPPNGLEREFTARLDQATDQRKPLMFHLDADKWSSTDSHPSPQTILDVEFEGGVRENASGNHCDDDSKTEEPHHENDQVPETPTKEPAEIAMKPSKSTKDVGLDPIEDEDEEEDDEDEHEPEQQHRVLTSWPTEFKRLQKEIIELWHTCNVSLVHRTYFFLLFQGDPTDAIYMEVELRRMVFLKDIFTRGEKTIVNGHTVTLTSSIKALHHERRMLSKQMVKKMSEQEREELFLKWGIGLDSRRRRLQLAHRLWSYTVDMNHIRESAYVVAKLVGFIEQDQQTPKEMFGLNFAPLRSSLRNYSFKRSLISLL